MFVWDYMVLLVGGLWGVMFLVNVIEFVVWDFWTQCVI